MTDTCEATDVLPLELTKGYEKVTRANDRAIRNGGYGQSDLGLKIEKTYLETAAEFIKTALVRKPKDKTEEALQKVLAPLSPELLALVGLNAIVHSIATGTASTDLFQYAGVVLQNEAWAQGLTKFNPRLAKRIEAEAQAKYGAVKHRRIAAHKLAEHHGYSVPKWTSDRLLSAGNWVVNAVVEALPDVFYWRTYKVGFRDYVEIQMNPEALSKAEEAIAVMVERMASYQPIQQQPFPWTGWKQKHVDGRLSLDKTFIRTNYPDVAAACKAAIADGSMKPALDGVTALQSVPYRINERVYSAIAECKERGIAVKGIPGVDVPKPPMPKPWDEMDKAERRLWKSDAHKAKLENMRLVGERLLYASDMETAARLKGAPFWTPMNCDWRGRVYALPHFCFAREDRVRALFLFNQGLPIGEEGLYWLKVHVANCGDFDKISKRPLKERVAWVDEHLHFIEANAANPLQLPAPIATVLDWKQADKPFLFLAACVELAEAIATGPTYLTRLPIAFDGSCSGLQHLALMTRDEKTARLVNLTNNAEPQDVYGVVAVATNKSVTQAATDTHYNKDGEIVVWPNQVAKMFLEYGIDRKVVKRNVMTYSYSSKKFGMASQQQTDLMDDLDRKVTRREIDSHPFEGAQQGTLQVPSRAARFIAGHVYEAIEATVQRPAQAMQFLQTNAKALAHEGKPLRWKTPVGVPWINRYHPPVETRVKLWLFDRGVHKPLKALLSITYENKIDKDRAANGVAPNFVHALDGAHLLRSVNACCAVGITNIATVHDSFSCLAPQAATMNKVIRRELIAMYDEHDVLAEVLEQAALDITQQHRHLLAPVPQYGAFNTKEIENADYAFS